MTKEEFFANPNRHYYSGRTIPDEWIAEAWECIPVFRDNATYEFVREASKNGSLEMVRHSLERLSSILPFERIIEIYLRARDRSPHREMEFRPDFERILGSRIAAFPRELTNSEVITCLGPELADKLRISDDRASRDHYL